MRHHHTLRLPRRTRRINHIRRMPRKKRHNPIHIRHRPRIKPGYVRAELRRIHHQHHPGVLDHKPDTLERQPRIHRQIRPTGLHHRQHPHHQLRRTLQSQRHHRLRTHPQTNQLPSQPIRARLQFRVRQLESLEHQRRRIRRPRRLLGEQVRQGAIGLRNRRSVALEELGLVLGIEDVDRHEREVRGVFDRHDQVGQAGVQQPAHLGGIDGRDRGHDQIETGRALVHRDGDRVIGVVPHGTHLDAVHLGLFGVSGLDVAVVEERGEQGSATGQARGRLRHRERCVLVDEQLREAVAQPGQRLAGTLPREIHPDREGVDEQTRHPVRGGTGVHPSEQDSAENDVAPAGHCPEHACPHQVEHRRRADTEAPRRLPHASGQRGVHGQPAFRGRASVTEHVRQAVRRGRLGDVAEQVGEVLLVFRSRHSPPRPRHELTERDRRGQPPGLLGHERPHLVEQHVRCRVVLDEVVNAHQRQPPAGTRLGRNAHVHQRSAAKVQPSVVRREHSLRGLVGDRQLRVAHHDLHRLPQALPHDRRTVDVVAVHDPLQRGDEGVKAFPGVELDDGGRHIDVGSVVARHQMVEEDAFLQRRQRIHILDVRHPTRHGRHHPGDLGLRQLDQRHHSRRQLGGVGRDQIRRNHHRLRTGHRGQPGRRRGGEQRPHRHRHAALPQPLHQRHRQQRMPTQRKEIVLDTNPFKPQDLGERGADDFLPRGLRRATSPRQRREVRRRKCLAVDFRMGRQRKSVKNHDRRRHHVRREPLSQESSHLIGRGHRTHDITDQPVLTRSVLPGDNRRLAHGRVSQQHALDFPRLHPETADLHLIVKTAQKNQFPVTVPAHPIPGAIHPLTRLKRTRHKPLTRQPRTTHITPRHTHTGNIKLTTHPHRNRLQPPIQHIHPHIGNRPPDRHHTTRPHIRPAPPHRSIHRRLSRTITIEHHPIPSPPRHQLPRQRLTTHIQHKTLRQTTQRQRRHRRRRQRRMRHPKLRNKPRQLGAQPPLRRNNHQRRTRHQRQQPLLTKHVKTRRRELRHPSTPPHPEPTMTHRQIHKTPMRNHHTLRHTRRTRRIHHIHRMIRKQRPNPIHIRHRPRAKPTHIRHKPQRIHHQHRSRILNHKTNTLRRRPRINRQISATRLQHRKNRDQQLR